MTRKKTKLVWILKLGDCCQTGIKILDKEKLVWVSGTHWRDGGHQFKLTTLHKAGKLGHLVNKHKDTKRRFKFKKSFLGPRGPLRVPMSTRPPVHPRNFNLVIFKGCRRQRHRHKGTATEGTAYKDPSDKF